MGDYVHLFADETERTQYERSAQYNEPYISATDDTFDAEYNKLQKHKYGVKYTDTETSMHDFTYVEYDAEIEYLESTGTQWIDTGINYDFTGTIKIIAQVIPINQNRSIIISNYCDGNAASLSAELGGTSNSHPLQPRFYMSLTKAAATKDTWRQAFTLNTSNEIILQYNKSNGQKIFTTQGSSTTETFTGNKYGTPRNFILFLDHRSDTSAIAYGVRIQKIQIYINNQLVSYLIPVRVGNTGYMYDKVSCQLLGNSGYGNFVLGQDKYDAQIEYLYNSYNAYIDSKIPFTTNSKWITQFEFQNKGNGGDLFGLRTPWSIIRLNNYIYIDRYYQGSSTYNRVINKKGWWGEANVRKITSIEITDTYVIPDGLASHKTTFASAGTNTYKTLDSGGAAICGGLSGQNDPLKIFYFKWYENSTLVLDMIPVRVGNVGYMYDRVSGRLFGNAGLGQFVLGPDV